MPGNTFGHLFRLITWGESHGPSIGGILDGVPPNLVLDLDHIQKALDERRPGHHSLTSSRCEKDQLEILSGVFEGKTLGTPLAFQVGNEDTRSQDYEAYSNLYRPGHGDWVYAKKYGHRDYRGGGRSSARETVARVVGGAIAEQVLRSFFPSVVMQGCVLQIGPHRVDSQGIQGGFDNPFFCPDPQMVPIWQDYLQSLKDQGLSAGALLEIQVKGIPAGLGEPVFDRLDADLAKALMSINAVKGVEIGEGFGVVTATQGFDEMGLDSQGNPQFLSNTSGGILAGISTGAPIVCRLALKPTSSTRQPRQTVTQDGEVTSSIDIQGRHDPCVGIRAVPIAKAMVALVLADHALRWRGQCGER